MPDLANLPRSIMPEEFFELVQESLTDVTPPEGRPDDKTVIALDGPGGGSWVAGAEGDRIVLEEGDAESALVRISLTVSDWREFVAGRVRDTVKDHVDAPIADPRLITKLLQRADQADVLRQFSGDIQIVVEDTDDDAEYFATFTLGGGPANTADPTTTIRITLGDVEKLVSRELDPQSAFFQGKIRIDGDMNLAMGLMTAAMSA